MERLRNPDLWGALIIIFVTLFFSALVVVNRSLFGFLVGSLQFTHWMSLIGGLWIAFVTPIYYVLKRRRPNRIKELVRIHIFGNLVAFLFISVHFTYWIISVSFMGTGLALFVAVFALVLTGLLNRFNLMQISTRYIRSLHVSMTTAFYLVLIIHILNHTIRL